MCKCGHAAVWHKMYVSACEKFKGRSTGSCACEKWEASGYEPRR